jgi:hypothetical protein
LGLRTSPRRPSTSGLRVKSWRGSKRRTLSSSLKVAQG